MNGALLSSKKMDYCTPKEFFAELDKEFHFTLDAAATEASAKCAAFYTPETDGLTKPWNIAGGALCSAIRPTGGRSGSGCERHTRKRRAGQLSFCLSRPERTPVIFTTTYWATRKSGGCVGGCGSRMKMGKSTRPRRFRPWWWSTTERKRIMEIERAMEILDPEHREHYESIEPVNTACRMGMEALARRIPRPPHPDEYPSILACPACGSGEYLYNEDGNEQRFCGQCGQAIDWSGE